MGLLVVLLVSSLAAGIALGAHPSATRAQASGLDTAEFAPADAVLYAAVNLDLESEQYTQSRDLLDRAGLTQLFEENAGSAVSSATGGSDSDDFATFAGGEAGLVVTSLAGAESLDLNAIASGDVEEAASEASTAATSGVAVVLRAGDPDAAFSQIQDDLSQSAADSGSDVQNSDYEGVSISSVPAGLDAEGNATEGRAIARVDDYILLGSSESDLEPLIDAQAGRTDSLADDNNLAKVQEKLNPDYIVFGFVNGPAVKDALVAQSGPDTETLLGDTGAALIGAYTGFVLWADDPGFRVDTVSIPSGDVDPATLLGNFDSSLAERVPGDSLLFVDGNDLGPSGLLDGVALLFAMGASSGLSGEATPTAVDPDQMYEDLASTLGFNIKTDFLDQMVGEFGIAVSLTNLMSPDGIGAILVSGVEDPSRLADTLSKIALLVASAAGSGTEYSTRDVEGSTVNVVTDTSGSIPVNVEYGVVNSEFMLGYGNGLQTYVDGPDSSLADNPQFQEVFAALPAEHGAALYIDLTQVVSLAQAFLGSFSSSGSLDADPSCGEYESQEAAQSAYDEDPGGLIDLDQDFDGEACEDYFATADVSTPAAGPDFSAIKALASVTHVEDGLLRTSTILYIAE